MTGRWVIVVDGAPLDDLQGEPLRHAGRVAAFGARELSTVTPRRERPQAPRAEGLRVTAVADTFARDLDAVLADVRALLVAKNAAYGDSALNPLRLFAGDLDVAAQLRVRIDDKLSRLARGTAAGEDVEKDLLGYLLLLRIARLRGGPGGGHEAAPDTDAQPSSPSSERSFTRSAPPSPASPRGPRSAAAIRAARHYFERRERQWSAVPAGTSWASWLASPEGVAWAGVATPATGNGNACNARTQRLQRSDATPATPPSSPSHSPSSPEIPEKEEEDARGGVATATPATGNGNACNGRMQRPDATPATATPPAATLRDNPLEVLARASGGRVSPFAAATDQVKLGAALVDIGLVGSELEAFGRALAGDGASKLWPKSEPAKGRAALTVGFFLGRAGDARMLVDGVTRWKELAAPPPPTVRRVEVSAEEAEAARRAFAEELAARRAAKGKAVAHG